MDKNSKITITSLNVNGLNNDGKKSAIFQYLSKNQPSIIGLTDTRLSGESQELFTRNHPEYRIFYSNVKPQPPTPSKGVIVMISRKADIKILSQNASDDGMSIILETIIEGVPILLTVAYGPSDTKKDRQNVQWWKELKSKIDSYGYLKQVITGDLNFFFDMEKDTVGYERQNRPKTAELIASWQESNEFVDS